MSAGAGPDVKYVTMFGKEDVMFRPVRKGWLKAESLIDGSVDLEFVMLLNEALDVEIENQYRLDKALNGK